MFQHLSPAVLPFVHEGLGNSSYLVDLGDGGALVVDPARDPRPYLAAAERLGLRIRYAVDTHLHADFVSGVRELEATGATIVAAAGAELAFSYVGLEDDEHIDVGGLVLEALATPGHTPEHLSYLLVDDNKPVAVFTGGAIITGSIARTDLIASDRTQELTRAAYRSVRERIGRLADDVPIYPTHGGGSFCSVAASGDRTTTVGRERSTNPAFLTDDEDVFVTTFLRGLGSFPPYFLRTRAINQSGAAVGAHDRLPAPLDPEQVQRSMRDGAVVVDARPFEAFVAGHVPGSISVELRAQFASWLGWVVPGDVPLVLVLDDDQDRADIVRQCLSIGYDDVAGELRGGIAAWSAAGYDTSQYGSVPVGTRTGTFVDVRQASELSSGMIPGALHAETGTISLEQLPAGPLTLYCGHGQRATTAASVLERAGARDLNVLFGGPQEWSEATGGSLDHA